LRNIGGGEFLNGTLMEKEQKIIGVSRTGRISRRGGKASTKPDDFARVAETNWEYYEVKGKTAYLLETYGSV